MNLGSSRSSNVLGNLGTILSGLISQSSQLVQVWSSFRSVAGSVGNVLGAGFGGSPVPTYGRDSSTLVAPNPRFNAPEIQTMSYGAQPGAAGPVAAGPSVTNIVGGFTPSQPTTTNLSQYIAQNPSAGTTYQPVVGAEPQTGGAGTGGPIDPNNPPPGGSEAGGGGLGNWISKNLTGPGLSAIKSNSLGALLFKFGLVSNMLPGTNDIVQSNLLLQRASYFAGQGNVASGTAGYVAAASRQFELATLGTVSGENPTLDAMNAMVAAQSYGLGGAAGSRLLTGVAQASNLVPGMGLTGTMRATAAMQQARNVNMLRGIGIQLRDPDTGRLAGPDEVIDKIWQKICRDYAQAYGTGKTPSLEEVQIALQPGNSLDSMLNLYFGNDPMLKTMVMNGLIYKAQGGGAITKAGVQEAGGTTEAVLSLSTRNAAIADLLGRLPTGGAGSVTAIGGFISANNLIEGFTRTAGEFFSKVLGPFKTFMETVLSAGEGFGYNTVAALSALAPKAEGGPVTSNRTYLVGEKGPEIFVPNTNGYIVPNDEIKRMGGSTSGGGTYNNTYNMTVNIPNANTPEVIAAIRKLMSDLERDKKVSES